MVAISVRTGHGYPIPFLVALGQRNAQVTQGYLTPLRRVMESTGAFTTVVRHYDLIHSLNAIPLLTRTPYIITFEDWLPRLSPAMGNAWLMRMLRPQLLKQRCAAILAISKFACRQMRQQHRDWPGFDQLLPKVQVFYPTPPPPPAPVPPKHIGSMLRLLFVGADFMRKGVPVIARAHESLQRAGIPVATTIVSTLQWKPHDYVGPPNGKLVNRERQRIIRSSMTVLPGLPNNEVRRLMQESHILLLPTFHDTFGYATIEALASGTPVIASATCAIPEVVEDGVNGALLPLPQDEIGMWPWTYRRQHPEYEEAYMNATEHLAAELVSHLEQLWEHRSDYPRMSAASLEMVERRFNRENARNCLERLYEQIVRGQESSGE